MKTMYAAFDGVFIENVNSENDFINLVKSEYTSFLEEKEQYPEMYREDEEFDFEGYQLMVNNTPSNLKELVKNKT